MTGKAMMAGALFLAREAGRGLIFIIDSRAANIIPATG